MNQIPLNYLDFVQLSKDQSYYGYSNIDEYIKACGSSDVPSPDDQFQKARSNWLAQIDLTQNVYIEYEYSERLIICLVVSFVMALGYLYFDLIKLRNRKNA